MTASGEKACDLRLGNLDGPEGNAFCILGRAQRALRVEADWPENKVKEWLASARSGDYADLLEFVLLTFYVSRQEKLTAARFIREHRLAKEEE